MAVYTKDSRLSEPIFENPYVVTVINRFGLYLGVGDATISDWCRQKEIDADFLLAIINTYLNPDYFPDKITERKYLGMITEYLQKTAEYYKNIQLPNIERHFNLLIRKETGELSFDTNASGLQLLNRFFQEVKQEIENMDLEAGIDLSGLEDKIRDLLSFFVIHLKGVKDHNLVMAVVSALSVLEKDIKQNNRIRNRIFRPLCKKLL